MSFERVRPVLAQHLHSERGECALAACTCTHAAAVAPAPPRHVMWVGREPTLHGTNLSTSVNRFSAQCSVTRNPLECAASGVHAMARTLPQQPLPSSSAGCVPTCQQQHIKPSLMSCQLLHLVSVQFCTRPGKCGTEPDIGPVLRTERGSSGSGSHSGGGHWACPPNRLEQAPLSFD